MTKHGPSCLVCGPATTRTVYDPETGETVCGCGAVMPQAAEGIASMDSWEETANSPTPGRELGGYVGGPAGPTRDHGGRRVRDSDGARRQQTWHHRSMRIGGAPESVRRCRIMVTTLSDKLALPAGVAADAVSLGERACLAGMPRGRAVELLAAAAVLLAVRRAGVARNIEDVEMAANVTRLGSHYRALCWKIGECPPPPSPLTYLPKVAAALGLTAAASRVAAEILARCQAGHLTAGRDPAVLAAASLYVAAPMVGRDDISAETVGKAGGVSAVSIRHVAAILKGPAEEMAERRVRT